MKMPMPAPEIAIIDYNTLSSLGLQALLAEIIPQAVIRSFRSFAELTDDTPDMYVHYFVSAQIFFEHTAFFLQRNISQDEKALVRSILQLHHFGHRHGHPEAEELSRPAAVLPDEHDLSAREVEVLRLVVRGLINKEIAERLHISLTTVISHRKNITEKLGIKSVPGLTIYAVMHGYVEADQV